MKALSLLQPWASLVVLGVKKIETRSWSTHYRGPILIHASKSRKAEMLADEPMIKKYIPDFTSLPYGAIIGQVTISDVIKFNNADSLDAQLPELTLEERIFGDYAEGRYGWILKDALEFPTPVAQRGLPWLWEVPEMLIPAREF